MFDFVDPYHGKSDCLSPPSSPGCSSGRGPLASPRYIVEGTGGNNGSLAVARGVRNWTITVTADLSRKTFRLWKIEALDQLFSLGRAKLGDGSGDIRRTDATRGFTATRAVAMPEPSERGTHFVAHSFAYSSSNGLFGHESPRNVKR